MSNTNIAKIVMTPTQKVTQKLWCTGSLANATDLCNRQIDKQGRGNTAYHDSPVVQQGETEGRAQGVGQGTGDVLVEHHKE